MSSAGSLRFRVRFDKQTEVEDPAGGTTSSWQEQFTRSASIKVDGGGESVQAQRLTGNIQYIIRVRKDSETGMITSAWRGAVVVNEVVQQFIALKVVDTLTDQMWVYIKGEAGVADGG